MPQPDLKVRAVAGQFQWTFDYLPADGDADSKPLFTVTAPTGAGRRPRPAGRQDDPPLPLEPRRDPRVLRPAVPVQARRRAGHRQPVRPDDRGRVRRPDVPRPVRRAVRHRPPDHGVRGPCHEPGRRSRPGTTGKLAAAQRDADRRSPSGGGAARSSTSSPRREVRQDRARRAAPTRRSRSTSTTRTRAPPHDVDILDALGKKVVRRAGLPGAGRPRLRRPAAPRRGPTSSSARSTRRSCSARSRSSKELRWRPPR